MERCVYVTRWCSESDFSSCCFLLTIVTLLQDAAIIGSTASKVAFLKPYCQPWVLLSQSDHICHAHRKLNSLNRYCCLWRRMEISLSLTESTSWSWLLCIKLIPLIAQGTRVWSWDCGPQPSKLIRNFTDLQCVFIMYYLPQTVQAAIWHLVYVPDTGWRGGKTRLFQVMLSRQHRWADLQWLSTIGLAPLITQFISIMSNSWSCDGSILK